MEEISLLLFFSLMNRVFECHPITERTNIFMVWWVWVWVCFFLMCIYLSRTHTIWLWCLCFSILYVCTVHVLYVFGHIHHKTHSIWHFFKKISSLTWRSLTLFDLIQFHSLQFFSSVVFVMCTAFFEWYSTRHRNVSLFIFWSLSISFSSWHNRSFLAFWTIFYQKKKNDTKVTTQKS